MVKKNTHRSLLRNFLSDRDNQHKIINIINNRLEDEKCYRERNSKIRKSSVRSGIDCDF